MATTSTSALFTRSSWLSNALGTPKRLLAAAADSRRLVDSAVISKSFASDFSAGMCASAAQPRSGLAPMIPTRILLAPPLLTFMLLRAAQTGGRAKLLEQPNQRCALGFREPTGCYIHRRPVNGECFHCFLFSPRR